MSHTAEVGTKGKIICPFPGKRLEAETGRFHHIVNNYLFKQRGTLFVPSLSHILTVGTASRLAVKLQRHVKKKNKKKSQTAPIKPRAFKLNKNK